MLIQRIEIQNYRSLREIDLDCETLQSTDGRALIALLGRNGTGKSSILYALDVFYDVAAKITTEDFYNHDPENEIMIRVTYGYLNEAEKDEFKSFIENDQLIVTKRITSSDGRITQKYYGAARQIPEFAACRNAANKTELREKYAELAAMQKFSGIPAKSKSAVEALANMATFEADHPEMLETVEREQQFFGPKEVGGGKLDNYTKFVLVPAVRDASVDAAKKGVIYELIDMIVLRQINRRDDVRRLRAEMEERILEVFSPSNLTELRDLGVSISALLEQYAPGSALRLEWGEPTPPQIPLPPHKAALVEDDFASPVSHTGHGLQRALILTLLQHLAMTPRPSEEEEAPEQADGEAPTEAKSGIHDPDLILAIEEPELYLHPSRCRYLSELLLDLSKPPTDTNSPKNQIIYATHSAYFVDLHRFDQLRIARKPKDDDYPAPHCVISKYSLDQAAKELAKIADRKPEDFTMPTTSSGPIPSAFSSAL